MRDRLIPTLAAITCIANLGMSASFELQNIYPSTFNNECLRIPIEVPADNCTVKLDGQEIPAVVDTIEGKRVLWVRTTIEPAAVQKLEIQPGTPKTFDSGVSVKAEDGALVLDNGLFAVRLPAGQADGIPAPVTAVRLKGKWVGAGSWQTDMALRNFSATVVDSGSVFGKVRLRYEFDGLAGIDGDVPAYAEVDVTLMPGLPFAVIEERHEMGRTDAWSFIATEGWNATGGTYHAHSGRGFGDTYRIEENKGTLRPPQINCTDPDLMINLFPRWNQHCKDGWMGAATGADGAVGAVVVLAGYWYWPHDNAIQCRVQESGDTLTLLCPTRRGMRYWWLMAGDVALFEKAQGLATAHGFESLDTIINSIPIRTWDDKAPAYSGYWPLSGAINPTGGVRGWGSGSISKAGTPTDSFAEMIQAQWLNSPHVYGSYWLYWSPENPNFFTDFNKVPIGMLARMKNHPRFKEFARMAIQKFREDMYHSITMPSGAGNECPGYQQYAMHHYLDIAKVCKDYLGEDATQWPRFRAGARFAVHLSQPHGGLTRTSHPGGDTHGGYHAKNDPRDFAAEFGVVEDVTTFTSEELQGFGAVLRNKCGTLGETYVAFKSGPSRGHFHGDQLSIHYAAYGNPIAVDHGNSYGPRASQEHMHNRLSFYTDDIPYANMDGYERLIAFKASDAVDIAVGQVQSWRLRGGIAETGAEGWHVEWPLHWFKDSELTYRRTLVLLKGEPDILVIRDQYEAPEPLHVVYPLFVKDNATVTDGISGTGAAVAGERLTDGAADFERLGVEPGWCVTINPNMKGSGMLNIFSVREVSKHTLVLDGSFDAEDKPVNYLVLQRRFDIDGPFVHFKSVSLFTAQPQDATFRFFPYFHFNGGLEATQGIRLETAGKSGQYITALIPRRMAAVDLMTLTLKGALVRQAMKSEETQPCDLGVTLMWLKDELLRDKAIIEPIDFNTGSRKAELADVSGDADEMACTLNLTIGQDKWIQGGAGTLKLMIKRSKAAVTGTFAGTFKGHDVGGAIEGTYAHDALPPVPIYAAKDLPEVESLPDGIRIGGTRVVFAGGIDDVDAADYVRVTRDGDPVAVLTGADIDLNRSQGEVGIFVPDAGYPFGEIPNWLIKQRIKVPDWAPDWAKAIRDRKQ